VSTPSSSGALDGDDADGVRTLVSPPGLDVDDRAGEGRDVCKPPSRRSHDDYRHPRWATAHIEGVDNLYAAASDTGGPCERGAPRVRIDFDGVGGPTASLHAAGANVNLSVWIAPEQIDELIAALEAAREDGETRWWTDTDAAADAKEGGRE